MDSYLNGGVQTDGSSVVLPGIATINDAKVDFIADNDVTWYVDYNYEHQDPKTCRPVGTIRIPAFLRHGNELVCSRSVLRRATVFLEQELLALYTKYPEKLRPYGIDPQEIVSIDLTAATELEFWVRTPDDVIRQEHLSTSQGLKEQYWKRTKRHRANSA